MKLNLSIFIILISNLFASINSNAQEEKYIGLFIYNFTKYFDWPEYAKSGDFLIQVIGHVSVYDELARITKDKKVGSQNIVIRSISSAEEIKNPQILFLGHWQSRQIPEVMQAIEGKPTLLISEKEGMLDLGSALNFVLRDGTIKFELMAPNVSSHKLKTDPRIRELAYKVFEE